MIKNEVEGDFSQRQFAIGRKNKEILSESLQSDAITTNSYV